MNSVHTCVHFTWRGEQAGLLMKMKIIDSACWIQFKCVSTKLVSVAIVVSLRVNNGQLNLLHDKSWQAL